jgi:hypothetical protein
MLSLFITERDVSVFPDLLSLRAEKLCLMKAIVAGMVNTKVASLEVCSEVVAMMLP